ncbi:MAG: 3-oxoacyl-[acyl-carrier-protein] reductase [Alphaproteobacteria bacterium]|jgi:3-oxoacyl-[acyl-carrier protein] reductase|nr:3-oxoacyl-[acyl-carrier-protein] reductase [Alphaproteobacteria bacterium]
MFDLTGKRALVTGASGGIGAAIARALHAQGASVALSGSRAAVLDAEVADLAERAPERAHAVPCDLSDAASADGLLGAAVKALGGIEILVHCAGITRDNLALRMKDAEWQDVIDVNLGAGFRLARASLRPMMKARWGRILFITSVVGATGNPGQANYAASKAGLTGLAKALATEVASRGVTVNCVAPGFIETAMTEALNEDQRQRITGAIPAAHIGAVDDVAAGCVYLASDEAAYVTGQTLHINGGMAMF